MKEERGDVRVSVKTTIEYICDLCDRQLEGSYFLPKDWAKIVIENPQLERDFKDKHICGVCAKDIARQLS